MLSDKINSSDLERILTGASLLTRFVDPKTHLPFLRRTRFLVVYGSSDTVIGSDSVKKLIEATPSPYTYLIKGGHINSDKPDLIEQLNKAVYEWLAFKTSALNP